MHDHSGHGAGSSRKLLLALVLTLVFAGVEAVYGWLSGSLALLGDAGHMLTDSMSLGLAAVAALLARRAPSMLHSYGFGRAEIMAALVNAVTMLVVVVLISLEAVERLDQPVPVEGATVMVVAFVGLLINLGAAWLLSGGGHDLNVRGALLHVLGDLLGSVAALVSGGVILLTGWVTIDPILSLLIVALISVSAIRVMREALHALMEGVPMHLDLEKIGHSMAGEVGVNSVHDLHVWSISASRVALSAHVVVRSLQDWPDTLGLLQKRLAKEFGIDHVTLQPEINESYVGLDELMGVESTSKKTNKAY